MNVIFVTQNVYIWLLFLYDPIIFEFFFTVDWIESVWTGISCLSDTGIGQLHLKNK